MSESLADHRLAKLLMPASVALVGASPKVGSVGHGMLHGLRGGGFKGRIYPINPNYKEIEGIACYPSLAALPERVDHALLGVANARLEAAMGEAVASGAHADWRPTHPNWSCLRAGPCSQPEVLPSSSVAAARSLSPLHK